MLKTRTLDAAQHRFGFALTVPALIAFLLLIFVPFARSLWLAFNEYLLTSAEPRFVGLANFVRLFADPGFRESWRVTGIFVICTTSITTLFGTTYALLLNEPMRGRTIIRAASLLPWVLPSTVTALLWSWLYNGQYGVVNAVLLWTGLIHQPIFFLSDSVGAMIAVISAKAWLSTPVVMLFVLAALQSLPQEQVEAARIDGANDFHVIRYVVLPHIRKTLGVMIILQAMGNLQMFDIIYAMTSGGPVRATTVFSIEVYRRAFENWDLGMASAIGVIWFLTIAVIAIPYLRSMFTETHGS
ncbi:MULTISPECIES: carbohydrate ABC transporter permease [unclassified Mesorhizobium]|uniref:carbohydrate ABC transporter permease n=1 Tax=unclassified Mesorhizobium TaxID=325217 RepID=UPI0015E2D287|nr:MULTISPECIES: sugar ABC transporter permease [unclassified Mesorhizobium]